MKKRSIVAILFAIVLMLVLPVMATTAEPVPAAAEAPVLDVAAKNLSLNNTIDLVFYVTVENGTAADVRLMTWTKAQTDYAYGTQEKILEPTVVTTYKQKPCAIFYYTGIAAKQMADDIYVRAFVEDSGVKYFSEADKYSILQYAFNKLNAATPDENLLPLLNTMLDYGAGAQTYFNYNTAHLANADYHRIKVVNGLLADLTDRGLYLEGETLTVTAPAQDAAGVAFYAWVDDNGTVLSTSTTYTYTVGTANTTLTAIYGGLYTVNAVNGTFANGTSTDTIYSGQSATITAVTPANGYTFSHWENSAGETVGTDKTLNVAISANETYKAYYVPFFGDLPEGNTILADLTNDWQQGGTDGSFGKFNVGTSATKHRVSFKEPVFLKAGETLSVKLPKCTLDCPWETDGNDSTTAACEGGCDLTAAIIRLQKNDTVSDSDFIPGYTLLSGGWETDGFTYTTDEDVYIMVTVKYSVHGSVAFNLEHECMSEVVVQHIDFVFDRPLGNYWQAELSDAISKIEANRKNSGSLSEFFILTDSHWPDNANFSPALISYLADKVESYNVVFLGDIIRRYNAVKQDAIDDEINAFYYALEGYSKVGEQLKIFTTLGNHDRNGSSNCPDVNLRLTEQEAYDLYIKRVEEFGVTVEGDPNKSYFDDTENKVRYIQFYFTGSLNNMIEDAYVDAGLAWVEEQVKALDSDWTVLLFTHGVFNGSKGTANEYTQKDQEVIRRILALQGEADAEIALWATGHQHEDRNEILYDSNGNKVRLLCFNADAYGNSNSVGSYKMAVGSIMEQSFGFFQIDTANEVAYFTRLGAGGDLVLNFGSKLEAGTEYFPVIVPVKVVNGTTSNGKGADTAAVDAQLTITADTISGYTFSHWVDKTGAKIGTTATLTLTVSEANTYKAVYTANSTTTPGTYQILSDLANEWHQGSYDGKFGGWSESLRGTRVTSDIISLKKGEKLSATFPSSVTCTGKTTCEGGTCRLALAYVILEKIDGSDTGNLFTDYKVLKSKWFMNGSLEYTATEDTILVLSMKSEMHGGEAFTLANEHMQAMEINKIPANAESVSIRIYNGKANNSSYPTVTVGSKLTLIADEIENHTFSHWVDKNGKTVATTATASITVTGQNTYRPVYNVTSGKDIGNNWVAGSYDGKMAAWAGDSHTLTPTRVTSKVFTLEAGQTITVSCPANVTTTKGTTCDLKVAYTLLTPVEGSNTGDFYADYTTTGTATWKKTYTNNTSDTVYIIFQVKPSDGNAGLNLSNEAMQEVSITIS